MKLSMRAFLVVALFLFPCMHDSAFAEASLLLFSGFAWPSKSDLIVRQSGGTDLTLNGVDWGAHSLRAPIYGGGRVQFWLPRLPEAGFGLEYTHMKVFAREDQSLFAEGTRSGQPVRSWENLGSSVERLGISLHLLMLTMQKRWLLSQFQAHVGLGIGAALPTVSARVGPVSNETTR